MSEGGRRERGGSGQRVGGGGAAAVGGVPGGDAGRAGVLAWGWAGLGWLDDVGGGGLGGGGGVLAQGGDLLAQLGQLRLQGVDLGLQPLAVGTGGRSVLLHAHLCSHPPPRRLYPRERLRGREGYGR